MAKITSAGLLPFRRRGEHLEVFLAHMGGPFWERKDARAWSFPKGEYQDGAEEPFDVALREFAEETGHEPPEGPFVDLGPVKQPSGKVIRLWAVETDLDPATVTSNRFEMEWPKGSGKTQSFLEVDRAEWYSPEVACEKLVKGQTPFVDLLLERLDQPPVRSGLDHAATEPTLQPQLF
jgi:predicted NUDIX family NTP pyrophosphohydrolase